MSGEAGSRRYARDVTVEGVERVYVCSVPQVSEGQSVEQLPLIVAIHGKGDNGRDFLIGTNLGVADAVVVAPTGSGLAWNPAPYAITTIEEDTAFIEAMIADVSSAYPVDPRRVYLAGFSNGGGFATVLAHNAPNKYAGVATVAGAIHIDLDEVGQGKPIDYLNIHGTWDDVVPYDGQDRGSLGVILPAREVVAAFEARNGAHARTVHIPVKGMSHEWPAGLWSRDYGNGVVDVTEEILAFFGIDQLGH